MTAFISILSLKLGILLVCAQAIVWIMVCSTLVPTIDPYIPRAKRPPAYLEPFLESLNATINVIIDRVGPCLTDTKRHPEHSDQSKCQQVFIEISCPGWFDFNLFWFNKCYFSEWHFPWQKQRRRSPSRTTVLALSAVTASIVRANAAATPGKPRSSWAFFDSDVFDILVDGSAMACILNSLADFVSPPERSSIRVKGFNGATSSTKVGTVA